MVAYNFQTRFIAPIQTGLKHQTMRPDRKGSCRHARVGERAQIYTGLRTKKAWKIIPDPVVVNISKMWLRVDHFGMKMVKQDGLTGKRCELSQEEMQMFAVHDGFGLPPEEAYGRLLGFWLETYGTGNFAPVLIEWQPPVPGSIL